MLISLFNRLENIVAKGENAGYQHFLLLSSPEQEVLRVNHCDHSPSVGVRRPFTFSFLHSNIYKYQLIGTKFGQNIYDHKISDEFDYGSNRTRIKGVICPWLKKSAIFHFVHTLASTNINQSAPNLVKIYMIIRSHMISILGLIRPERLELFDLELKTKIAMFHFVYTLASTNINQSSPNLVKIYMTIRSQMSSILDLIGQNDQSYLPLNLKKKNAIFCFVFSLASTSFTQSSLNLAKIHVYITIRSWMSLIMGLIGLEQLELFALELEKLLHLTQFTL